jgi:hypothetical protein
VAVETTAARFSSAPSGDGAGAPEPSAAWCDVNSHATATPAIKPPIVGGTNGTSEDRLRVILRR